MLSNSSSLMFWCQLFHLNFAFSLGKLYFHAIFSLLVLNCFFFFIFSTPTPSQNPQAHMWFKLRFLLQPLNQELWEVSDVLSLGLPIDCDCPFSPHCRARGYPHIHRENQGWYHGGWTYEFSFTKGILGFCHKEKYPLAAAHRLVAALHSAKFLPNSRIFWDTFLS